MKNLILLSLFTFSLTMNAETFILKKDSLACTNNKTGKNHKLKANVVVTLDAEQCLDIPTWPKFDEERRLQAGYEGLLKYRNDISLKIKHSSLDISCTLNKGDQVKKTASVTVKVKDSIILFKSFQASLNGDTVDSDPKTMKEWREADFSAHGKYKSEQEVKYSFASGKPIIHPSVLNGKTSFGHGRDNSSRTKYHWYMLDPDEKDTKIIEEFNYISSLSCGDHQVSQAYINNSSINTDKRSNDNTSSRRETAKQ